MANFQRTVEDFTCENCGANVTGNGYTNHCPQCLWSKHVDIQPGDRAAECRGLMEPIAAGTASDELFVVQRCVQCGHIRRNRSTPSDNRDALLALFGRPIPD